MILPAHKPRVGKPSVQLGLFGEPEVTLGAIRHWTGDFFEEATAAASGMNRYRTDSQIEYCPDIGDSECGVFGESKACGRNGSLILYRNRLRKDRKFLKREEVNRLTYWVWSHDVKVSDYRNIHRLRGALASCRPTVTLVELRGIVAAVRGIPVRVVSSGTTKSGERLGYGSGLYGIGWTIRISQFREASIMSRRMNLEVYGREVECDVHLTRESQADWIF